MARDQSDFVLGFCHQIRNTATVYPLYLLEYVKKNFSGGDEIVRMRRADNHGIVRLSISQ